MFSSFLYDRFHNEISQHRLVVVNAALSADYSSAPVVFYVHRSNHVLSQFLKPDDDELHQFQEISVMSCCASDIIERYGNPYYVKIDLEHYDQKVLEQIFASGIRPSYISAETHNIEIFALLVAFGRYKSFKLVDGASVGQRFVNHPVSTSSGVSIHSFPHHSAGPFGQDIPGGWLTAESLSTFLQMRLGWKDVHATSISDPDLLFMLRAVRELSLREIFRALPGAAMRSIRSRLVHGLDTRSGK